MLMNRLMPGGPDAYDGHNHNHNHDRDHNERSRSPDGRAPQAAASAGAFPAIHPGIGSTSSSSIDIDSIGSAAHGNNGGFAVPLASVAQAGQAGQAGHAGHAGHGSNPWAAAASSSLVLPSPSSSLFERSIAALASTFRGSLDADDLMLLDMAPFDGDASDALAAASDAGSAATAAGSAAGSAAGGLALDARSYAHTHPHAYAHAAYGTGMFTQQPLYASQQRSLPIGHHLSNHHQHHHQQQHQHPLAASFTPSHPADFLSASGSGSPAASSDGHDDSAAASASRPQSDRTKQQPPLQQSPLPDPAHRRGGPESASPDLPLKTAARPPLISVSAPGTARSQPARPPPIQSALHFLPRSSSVFATLTEQPAFSPTTQRFFKFAKDQIDANIPLAQNDDYQTSTSNSNNSQQQPSLASSSAVIAASASSVGMPVAAAGHERAGFSDSALLASSTQAGDALSMYRQPAQDPLLDSAASGSIDNPALQYIVGSFLDTIDSTAPALSFLDLIPSGTASSSGSMQQRLQLGVSSSSLLNSNASVSSAAGSTASLMRQTADLSLRSASSSYSPNAQAEPLEYHENMLMLGMDEPVESPIGSTLSDIVSQRRASTAPSAASASASREMSMMSSYSDAREPGAQSSMDANDYLHMQQQQQHQSDPYRAMPPPQQSLATPSSSSHTPQPHSQPQLHTLSTAGPAGMDGLLKPHRRLSLSLSNLPTPDSSPHGLPVALDPITGAPVIRSTLSDQHHAMAHAYAHQHQQQQHQQQQQQHGYPAHSHLHTLTTASGTSAGNVGKPPRQPRQPGHSMLGNRMQHSFSTDGASNNSDNDGDDPSGPSGNLLLEQHALAQAGNAHSTALHSTRLPMSANLPMPSPMTYGAAALSMSAPPAQPILAYDPPAPHDSMPQLTHPTSVTAPDMDMGNRARHMAEQTTDGSILAFNCSYTGCTEQFGTFAALQLHLAAHPAAAPKPKPFRCDMCPQTFSRSHDLKRHYYVHSQSKPHACRRCGKGFSRRDAVRRHERSVAEGKKVQCVPVDPNAPMMTLAELDAEDEAEEAALAS